MAPNASMECADVVLACKDTWMTFAEELKEWRRERGLTQREAAAYFRVAKETLEDWEQGRHRPSSVGPILHLMAIERGEKRKAKSS